MQALTKDVLVAKQPVTSHFIRMIGSNIRTNEWSYFQANCAGQSDVYWIYTHGKLPHVLSLDSICIVILFCGKILLHYSSKYSKIYWQKTLFIKRVIDAGTTRQVAISASQSLHATEPKISACWYLIRVFCDHRSTIVYKQAHMAIFKTGNKCENAELAGLG